MKTINKVVLISSLTIMGGCETVHTRMTDDYQFSQSMSEGLTYFLPRKFLKLTLSAEILELAKLEKALKTAQEKEAGTKAEIVTIEASIKSETALLTNLQAQTPVVLAATSEKEKIISGLNAELVAKKTLLATQAAAVFSARASVSQASGGGKSCK